MAYVDERTVTGLAGEHGVPTDVAGELAGLLRPCVLLVRRADLPETGRDDLRPAGRTGGHPPLPEGDEGSRQADPFVLVVDCAALPRDHLDIELPPDGQLLFFTTFEYEPEDSAVLHVPAGVPTAEPRLREDAEASKTPPYEPHLLYPVPGLTIDHDWHRSPLVQFLNDDDGDGQPAEALGRFVEALVNSVHGGTAPHSVAQIGGFSDQWQVPPDQDGTVLLAQISGNGVDHGLFTLNLIVGTRQDIAAGRWEHLHFEQQC